VRWGFVHEPAGVGGTKVDDRQLEPAYRQTRSPVSDTDESRFDNALEHVKAAIEHAGRWDIDAATGELAAVVGRHWNDDWAACVQGATIHCRMRREPASEYQRILDEECHAIGQRSRVRIPGVPSLIISLARQGDVTPEACAAYVELLEDSSAALLDPQDRTALESVLRKAGRLTDPTAESRDIE